MTRQTETGMAVQKSVTSGNLLSIAATGVSLAAGLVSLSLAYGELKAQDEKFSLRIERLELQQKQNAADHDILIEIRSDLRILRQQVEAAIMTPQRRASNTDALRTP